MTEVQIEMKTERLQNMLVKLAQNINDLTPIWKKFIDYYQNDIMPKTFDRKGDVMGAKWAPLTEKYRIQKEKKYPGMPLMVASGKLKTAATGGTGWKQTVNKKTLSIGVSGEKYYEYVQEREKNGRYFFNTKTGDIPVRAYSFLIKEMDAYIEAADNG